MTYCSSRVRYGQTMSCEPSSFIAELDDSHLTHTSYDDLLGAEPSSDELDNFFGDLKGMLDDL